MEIKLKKIIIFFAACNTEIEREFSKNIIVQKFKKGTFVTIEGDKCDYFTVIKSGVIRVY